ncbi:hypothetical protein CsatA_018335 [Cannabis sativa]
MTEVKAALNSKIMQTKNDERSDWVADSLFVKGKNESRDLKGGYNKSNYKSNQNKGHNQGMHDGQVRLIQEVRYVPELKRNLLSISELTSRGCTIKIDSSMKVMRGTRIVMKGDIKNGIYYVQGETIVRKTNLVVKSSDRDNTRLWHMRLVMSVREVSMNWRNRVFSNVSLERNWGSVKSVCMLLRFKTPQEFWIGEVPSYDLFKVFGCTSYGLIRQDKLEPRAIKCLFLGYLDGVKGYKLWCLEDGYKKCIIRRDAVFKEHEMAMKTTNTLVVGGNKVLRYKLTRKK